MDEPPLLQTVSLCLLVITPRVFLIVQGTVQNLEYDQMTLKRGEKKHASIMPQII